jgi:transcriptional regulator with XRE-family HTH domain
MNPTTFGELVKARREELRVDQRTLASLAGVAVHTVSNIELGRGNPTLKVVSRLLDVLGLELVSRARTTGAAR